MKPAVTRRGFLGMVAGLAAVRKAAKPEPELESFVMTRDGVREQALGELATGGWHQVAWKVKP